MEKRHCGKGPFKKSMGIMPVAPFQKGVALKEASHQPFQRLHVLLLMVMPKS
jgi:hypothetical protein